MQSHHQERAHARGLRPVTPGLRRAEDYARQWFGLPDDGSKGKLLQLLEDLPGKSMAVSDAARDFLFLLVKMQPAACFRSRSELVDQDPELAGLALISTWPDSYLAAKLDVHVRSLARYRTELKEAGWICFRDSPDRRRYRLGLPEAPEEAYGIDLRPLVARFEELLALRGRARDQVRQLLQVRKDLSCRRNRIRALGAVVSNELARDLIETGLKAISAGIRIKDIDNARLTLVQANETVAHLEALLDQAVIAVVTVTQESGAPDEIGAQLDPTASPRVIKEDGEGRSGYASRAPLPSPASDADEDMWVAADYEPPQGPVVEVSIQARRGAKSPPPRVTCPTAQEVLRALPAVLATRGWVFGSFPDFRTATGLAVAYGQSSASRLGLSSQSIRAACVEVGPLQFAVAALLAEFTPGISQRTGYLKALLGRLTDDGLTVDMWSSWQRLWRTATDVRSSSLFTVEKLGES